jgi:hypothetical protein
MNVTVKGFIARPEKTEHGYVWWGADDHLTDPRRGLIPWHLRNRLTPDKPPPPGRGGAWYDSERHAVADLARVVLEILNEQKGKSDAQTR